MEHEITNLQTVASIDSMTPFLAGDQSSNLEEIARIKEELLQLRFPEADPAVVNLPELSQTLFYTQSYLGLAADETQKAGETNLCQQLKSLRQTIVEFRQQLANGNEAMTAPRLTNFQRALFMDIQDTFETLRTQDNSSRLREEDLPPALRHRFIGKTGKYLLQVYPKSNVWQRANQEAFVQELRRVAPAVTGTPVQLYEYETLLKDSYIKAAWYALGAIIILTFFHFRTIGSILLALLPVAVGTIWMVGLMGLLGVPFNPANIMTLPLVIGIGVTNGIHILNRFTEEQNPSILGQEHRQSGPGFGADCDRRIWESDPGEASRHCQPGHCDVHGSRGLYARGPDDPARPVDDPGASRLDNKKTQWRQCTIVTGSGGTEVKTSSTPRG